MASEEVRVKMLFSNPAFNLTVSVEGEHRQCAEIGVGATGDGDQAVDPSR